MTIDGSILDTVKTAIGYPLDYTPFDAELIMYVNMALRYANQTGVGKRDFVITSNAEQWSQFLSPEEVDKFSDLQTYITLQVKLLHDPPTNSFLVDSIKKTINELEWRLNVDAEFYI